MVDAFQEKVVPSSGSAGKSQARASQWAPKGYQLDILNSAARASQSQPAPAGSTKLLLQHAEASHLETGSRIPESHSALPKPPRARESARVRANEAQSRAQVWCRRFDKHKLMTQL